MRLCLINPLWTAIKGYEDSFRVPFPIGLGYIASYVKQSGHDVKIIDALIDGWRIKEYKDEGTIQFGLGFDKVAEVVMEYAPDVIGISCMFTSQSNNLHKMAETIKNKIPDIPIIVGGGHVSCAPYKVMEDTNIDFAVVGEGEQTTLELIECIEKGGDISKIKGIYYRDNGIKFSGSRPPIDDIDKIPFPAYELINMDEYFKSSKMGLSSRSSIQKKCLPLITSRGCPYECNFCSVNLVSGRKWRARSAENVLDELEYLKEKYDVEHIFFEDDNLTLDVARAEKIFSGIIDRGIDITWETPNGIRADRLTPYLVKTMKMSGCIGLTIAVESGDQKFLNDTIHKKLNLKDLKSNAEMIRKFGIDLGTFFIIGIPGETEKTIKKTINLSKKLAQNGIRPYFNIAVPLPGTDMYKYAKQRGYLTKSPEPLDYLMAMQAPLLKTDDYYPERLLEWRKKAMMSAAIELILHNPISLLQSETFLRFKKEPFSILKNIKILFRGTC